MQDAGRWAPIAILGVFMIVLGLSLPFAVSMLQANTESDGLHMKRRVDMVLYDKSGKVKDERHFDNMIVNAGIQGVASRIAPHDGTINSSAPYNYIALGTGNTAVDASQTALAAELPTGATYSRMQDTTAQYTTSSCNKLILSVTFPSGQATGTLRESGLFNAATGGNMLARQMFDNPPSSSAITKAAGDTLTVTWTISLSPT
jgi:hypothetical protein